jgi:hypothetical protein
MPSARRPLRSFASFATLAFAVAAPAQTLMGTVSTHDAQVTGGLEVRAEQARLLSNTGITAYDRTAPITLARGGEALVCATSQFHLLHSGTGTGLLFGLDRGAFELHGPASPQDVILTPDIRFTLEPTAGPPKSFALTLRVTPSGDTCVDNAGTNAPVLLLADAFSSASYRLIPGQHVLFEHGSLHEVVDNERSPCGCPAPVPTVVASNPNDHPFPAAASEGLAPTTPVANTPPAGEKHTQIATTFTYGTGPDGKPLPPPASIGPTPTTTTSTEPPPTPPGAHDLIHSLGHFLHKLFHPDDKPQPAP